MGAWDNSGHISDEFLCGEGRTFEEALSNVLNKLPSLIRVAEHGEERQKTCEARINGEDEAEIVVKAINEVIFFAEVENLFPQHISLSKHEGSKTYMLKIKGKKVKALVVECKSATYHGLKILHDSNHKKWKICVLVDT